MALHHASSLVTFMGCAHMAAATEYFVALEHHSIDKSWWEDLVTGLELKFLHPMIILKNCLLIIQSFRHNENFDWLK